MSSTKGADRKNGEREIMGGPAYAVNCAALAERLPSGSAWRFIAACRVCLRVPGVSSALACVESGRKPRLAQFLNPTVRPGASNRQRGGALSRKAAGLAGRSVRRGDILVMGRWVTRRRTVGALVAIAVVGALAAVVVIRSSQRASAATGDGPPVALEFNPADLAGVEARALSRWLPVSGALQPVNQSTV